MKKSIIIEILLLFIFAVLIAISIIFLQKSISQLTAAPEYHWEAIDERARAELMYGIFLLLAAIADLVVIVLIALKDFPKIKQSIETRKTARKEAKKQKRIADLQAELDKLNAEDKTDLNS